MSSKGDLRGLFPDKSFEKVHGLEGYRRTTNRLSDSLRILIGLRLELRHGLFIYGRKIPD